MRCLKCSSEAIVKNGHMKGLQRYKCKQCAYQFTQETPRGKPMKDKILALILYLSGLSMNMIAQIVGVSTQSVMRWIKLSMQSMRRSLHLMEIYKKLKLTKCTITLVKKNIFSGSGKLLIITPSSLLDGNVVIVVRKP